MNVKIVERGDDVSFAVYATPRARRSEFAGERDGALWVRLAAPPVDGAANEALARLLAERLNVPRAAIRLVAGATGRQKRVQVSGVTVTEAKTRLGIAD